MDHGILPKRGKLEKLESPDRVRELDPAGTLDRLGVGGTVCDIGAGSGLFSLAAAERTKDAVYAVDTDADILNVLAGRAKERGLSNLHTLPVDGYLYPIPADCADWALLVTTLHEIGDIPALFAELRRILKPGGRAALIEFRAGQTPMGPPPAHRLGAEAAQKIFEAEGYQKAREFVLGDNLYCQVYENADKKSRL